MITEGIIVTISASMLKDNGPRVWLRNFMEAMSQEGCCYYLRQSAAPKRDILYVYLCMAGKIRYRAFFAGTHSGDVELFSSKEQQVITMSARNWILITGPIERAPQPILMKGFRGWRYTDKLF